eukprot:TRINITY_DN9447_c0_g1_i2.p1 TRINITY_DN9447_c0_g1~~TRINITY_DN9447_c0_g1_i2.p1  ORF type:complete len:173 (-),score=46.61 TRINITY_DN9447_c0_g1_i2:72-590(-)
MAEIYMTDECYEIDAESQCNYLLEEAVKLDGTNSEALMQMANFRICQNNQEDAFNYLEKCRKNWTDATSYNDRIQTSKLYLELAKYQTSSDILKDLISEDNTNAETWFLLAISLKSVDVDGAMKALEKTEKIFNAAGGPPSEYIIGQIQDLKIQLKELTVKDVSNEMDVEQK